jgi:hypothetical protein
MEVSEQSRAPADLIEGEKKELTSENIWVASTGALRFAVGT